MLGFLGCPCASQYIGRRAHGGVNLLCGKRVVELVEEAAQFLRFGGQDGATLHLLCLELFQHGCVLVGGTYGRAQLSIMAGFSTDRKEIWKWN